jgi:hypothetical protein
VTEIETFIAGLMLSSAIMSHSMQVLRRDVSLACDSWSIWTMRYGWHEEGLTLEFDESPS